MTSQAYTARTGLRFVAPKIDATTLGAWSFDLTRANRVGGADATGIFFATATGIVGPRQSVLSGGGNTGSGGTATFTHGAITVAFWVMPTKTPTANHSMVGWRQSGGSGNPHTRNFPWTVDFQQLNDYRFYWQNGGKNGNIIQGKTKLTLGVWQHIVATRPADGLTGYLYRNGVLDSDPVVTLPPDGGSSISSGINFMATLTGSLSQVIVNGASVDAAGALALYNEMRGAVPWRP